MTDRKIYTIGGVKIGGGELLSEGNKNSLIKCFERDGERSSGVLSGRAPVKYLTIPEIGPVVVKQYVRGGALRYFRSSFHIRAGRVRSEKEYALLLKVRELGIPAPEPIAFAWQGGRIYRAWLVTRQLLNHQTLADISRVDEERARKIVERFVPVVQSLVHHRIFHVDLHPGNVVIDGNDEIFVVDFDKGRIVNSKEQGRLADRYLCRWRRAVIKHGLSDVLTEVLCSALRRRDLFVNRHHIR